MAQSREAISQHLTERLCWQVARRDDHRVARRLYRKQVLDGVYRLDEGALRDDFFHCLQARGIMAWLEHGHGTASQRTMVPCVPYVLRYGVKPLVGIESLKARPSMRFSDVALMHLVGFNAQPVRDGVCQRGASTRQGERTPGPICPATLAKHLVKRNLGPLEVLFNGAMRALAKAGGFGTKVTGIVDATDLETTAQDEGCGQATRKRNVTDKHGTVPEIAGTVDGWNVISRIDALPKIPLARKRAPIQTHETLFLRALVTQARTTLVGETRRHNGVFDSGFWDGADLWWLDQHGLRFVVPAKANMAVTADARAQAAAGAEITRARRVYTVRQGQGTRPRPHG